MSGPERVAMRAVALKETLVLVMQTAKERDLTFLAAGFAFYAFVSVIPLVLLALVIGSLLNGEGTAQQLVLIAGDALPPAGEELVVEALTTEAGRVEATVVALVVAAWGALKVFRGLSLAFDAIYGAESTSSILVQIRDGFVVIVCGAGAIALMIVVGTILRVAADAIPLAGMAGWLTLLVGLMAVFLPVYYVLPPTDVSVLEALPGTVATALGWGVLQVGFQLYVENAARYEAYGVLGGVLLFVTWLYFAGILILLGAVVNVVVSRPERAVEP